MFLQQSGKQYCKTIVQLLYDYYCHKKKKT